MERRYLRKTSQLSALPQRPRKLPLPSRRGSQSSRKSLQRLDSLQHTDYFPFLGANATIWKVIYIYIYITIATEWNFTIATEWNFNSGKKSIGHDTSTLTPSCKLTYSMWLMAIPLHKQGQSGTKQWVCLHEWNVWGFQNLLAWMECFKAITICLHEWSVLWLPQWMSMATRLPVYTGHLPEISIPDLFIYTWQNYVCVAFPEDIPDAR